MNRRQKKQLYRIVACALLLCAAYFADRMFAFAWYIKLLVYLVPYLTVGAGVLLKAVKNIFRGQVFDENFLMAIATVGALILGEYPEATFVMLFYQVGELFESIAVGKSRRSISQLMDIKPDHANIEIDGQLKMVSPEDVHIGDIITVKPGEKIPLDGIILSGNSALNTVALTGEAVPRDVREGDAVTSGCVNISGLLQIRVEKEFGESTVSRILDLVENSSAAKSRSENFITRFSKIYTPAVVLAALLIAVVPPLFNGQWASWINRGLIMLVVSCPCALVLSVPLSFFGGIGGASRRGILIKGSNYLEELAKIEAIVFDKTGTLTRGEFKVQKVLPEREEDILELAALAEEYSDHPIALSLKAAYGKTADPTRIGQVKEHAGHGVEAMIDGRQVLAGNSRLMEQFLIAVPQGEPGQTHVFVAVDGIYAGMIEIADDLKEDAVQAVQDIQACGVKRIVMLTGDTSAAAEAIAARVGIQEVRAQLLPQDKVTAVEEILSSGQKTAFVGDGINDAPVIARADVGIAMGALGADAAIEAADIVLMDDKPSKIAAAIRVARRTRSIVLQNIVFALTVKIAVLVLSALDLTGMGAAIFADVGVLILSILNAMRALYVHDGKSGQHRGKQCF